MYSYSLWAPTVIIPFLLAVVFGLRARRAAVTAMVVGLIATSVWTWGLGDPFGVTGLMVGLVANATTFAIVYLAIDKRTATTAKGTI